MLTYYLVSPHAATPVVVPPTGVGGSRRRRRKATNRELFGATRRYQRALRVPEPVAVRPARTPIAPLTAVPERPSLVRNAIALLEDDGWYTRLRADAKSRIDRERLETARRALIEAVQYAEHERRRHDDELLILLTH